nr:MAG TPA: hypothetical protein [Caudoviricetes sp.]
MNNIGNIFLYWSILIDILRIFIKSTSIYLVSKIFYLA